MAPVSVLLRHIVASLLLLGVLPVGQGSIHDYYNGFLAHIREWTSWRRTAENLPGINGANCSICQNHSFPLVGPSFIHAWMLKSGSQYIFSEHQEEHNITSRFYMDPCSPVNTSNPATSSCPFGSALCICSNGGTEWSSSENFSCHAPVSRERIMWKKIKCGYQAIQEFLTESPDFDFKLSPPLSRGRGLIANVTVLYSCNYSNEAFNTGIVMLDDGIASTCQNSLPGPNWLPGTHICLNWKTNFMCNPFPSSWTSTFDGEKRSLSIDIKAGTEQDLKVSARDQFKNAISLKQDFSFTNVTNCTDDIYVQEAQESDGKGRYSVTIKAASQPFAFEGKYCSVNFSVCRTDEVPRGKTASASSIQSSFGSMLVHIEPNPTSSSNGGFTSATLAIVMCSGVGFVVVFFCRPLVL
eukprot:gb/GECG01011244.1/.p1 GENE.gb/GECG01011244.1/~~gb/GECG01011244.1/.p1  ORF type:complete len:411 (+),score=21.11 gb/GECG01011244.1/:1-1233(+)